MRIINKVLIVLLNCMFITIILIENTIGAANLTDNQILEEKDIIHFISTGNSDAILIESNGKFALIDSAEDTGTSRIRLPKSEIDAINGKGYEDVVIEFLKEKGVKKLEFAIATHSHSDHIGNFDLIFDLFPTKKLYTREYKEIYSDENNVIHQLFKYKVEYTWDNQEVYDDMINSAKRNNVNIIYINQQSSLDNLEFEFGDFMINIVNNNSYNTKEQENNKIIYDENSNSLGVVISKGNRKAFLAGDITNSDGDEDYLVSDSKTRELIKNVDVFKMAHHGISGTESFIKYINPKITIITGNMAFIGREGMNTIKSLNLKNIYTTNENFHISVEFRDDGNIVNNAKYEYCVGSGWIYEGGKNKYSQNGKLVIGWQYIPCDGIKNWYYFNSNGEMITGWILISKNWYYLNYNGIMQTGWIKDKEIWYYLGSDGAMLTGWRKINDLWYYFNESGKMQAGWLYEFGTRYYLKNDGSMATGWTKIYSDWYYFDYNGAMQTGWLNYNGIWYYLNTQGSMITDWAIFNGKYYYFNGSGAMQTGWQLIGGAWYYFYSSGNMAVNTVIDGWSIDGSGVATKQ